MKQTIKRVSDLRSEYRFDYSKARRNRFARRWGPKSGLVVLVDAEMAKMFKTPEAVNHALHSLADAIPKA